MLNREWLLASIACRWEGMRLEPVSEAEAVPELVGRQCGAVGPVGECGQPSPCLLGSSEAALGVGGALLDEFLEDLDFPTFPLSLGCAPLFGVGLEVRL